MTDAEPPPRSPAGEGEHTYREIFAISQDAILIHDTERIIEANDAALRMYGYPRDEFIGMKILDISAEPEKTAEAIGRTMGGRKTKILMRRHRRKDGSTFPVEISGGTVESGGRKTVCAVIRDITRRVEEEKKLEELVARRTAELAKAKERLEAELAERKSAEEALLKSEEQHRLVFETAVEGIAIFEQLPDGRQKMIDCNRSYAEMSGYSREDLLETGFTPDLAVSNNTPEEEAEIQRRLLDGRPYRGSMSWCRPDGAENYIEYRAASLEVGGRKLVIGIDHDVTERRLAEKALRESEETHRALIEGLPQSVMIIQDAKVVFANATAARFVGVGGAGELTGRDSDDFIVESEVERLISFREKRVAGGAAPPRYETSLRRADGSGLPVEIFASRIEYGGRPAVLVMHVDLSESRAAERAIRESEARYRSLFRGSRDAITFTSPDGRFLDVNDAALEMFGYTRDEMLELPVREHYADPVDRNGFLAEMKEKGRVDDFEIVFARKDGTPRDCLISSIPYRGSGGGVAMYQNIIRDVTERKLMEEEQRKAAKLESVGLLAGGIAHDFNNIMSAITGNIALAKLLVAADPYVSERLSEAEAAAGRVKGLTRQLLTFSKGGLPVTEAASIAEIVEQSAVFALRGSNVDLNLAVAEDLMPAEVDRGQIGQVIDNLVINAKQAMAEGGTLRVRIENARAGPGSGLPLAEGDYVRLTIADEGVGIPPENLDRIFDPYFTTKQKGSGLGLAVCYAIVRKHEGHMAVESEPGAGATFTVYLPATTKPAGEAAPPAPADMVRGEGRVLLMDDEEPILAVGREILVQLGYQVETATSGAEVVEKYRAARESGEPFDAVLMDLTVRGGMGGREAMEKLLEIDPGVRALVSSGYSNDPVMTNFAAHGFAGVVPKPYDVVQMSQALRDAVAGDE